MIYIETSSTSPRTNLAFEEYFFNRLDVEEEICMLWQNEPAVVVGRFQNIWGEVNLPFAEAQGIPVLRRISGGGTVYHDLGNLCFTFIVHGIVPGTLDFSPFSRRIQTALARLGITAGTNKRNDLLIEGKKICGNAMSLHKERLLFHGTLLYDSDLEILHQVLSAPSRKIESRATPSVRSQVTTIKRQANASLGILEFKQSLKAQLFGGLNIPEYEPTQEDRLAIQELADTKYGNWEWNYGHNPPTKIEMTYPHRLGSLEANLEVDQGRIKICRIRDDSLQASQIEEIERRLNGIRYTAEEVRGALESLDWGLDSRHLTREDILHTIMGA
jgi:lipoate---protein ligase